MTVERASLDYRKPLDRPFFSISLRGSDGRALEPVQVKHLLLHTPGSQPGLEPEPVARKYRHDLWASA